MVYVIAEAGVDHEGDYARALALLNAAVEAKADCFKLQYYKRGFQGEHRVLPWLTQEHMFELENECSEKEIDFLITPHDTWALEFIAKNTYLTQIKIGGSDWHLLDAAINSGKNLIISTGGRSEIRVASVFYETRTTSFSSDFLYCIPKYPCPASEINWKYMSNSMITGYSDHTEGAAIALAAVGIGKKVIEKHITLERNIKDRSDTTCSLLPAEWPKFVQDIRTIEQALAP
tara:strand:- start:44 stop:739 length:696 start_codon:yes stop_codon:yes gene_type:complete